jgi:carbonic anhydrase
MESMRSDQHTAAASDVRPPVCRDVSSTRSRGSCGFESRRRGSGASAAIRSGGVMIVVRSRFVAGLLATGAIAASSSLLAADPKPDAAVLEATEQAALKGVLTREEQAALTPQAVLDTLLAGNERFVRNDLTQRNHSQRIREAYAGQFPKAVVLSCLDSRIPVEDVFDRGIGDIFVARVAGNFVNEDILGSMEFACHVAGAKLIMVIGHTNCGAVKAAIDDVKLGNITPMLAKIRPAIERGRPFDGLKASDNPAYVAHVCRENVRLAVEAVRQRSEILRTMETKGEIKIVGAYYDLGSGTVSPLP